MQNTISGLRIIKRYLTGGEKIIVLGLASIVFGIIFTSSAFAATMNTDVNIRPSMTLSVSTNDITLNLNPATKPFDSKDFSITIGTNNPSGYSLYLNADDTNLVNVDDSTKIIETLPSSTPASGYDQSSFPANYWGYRKSNGSTSSGNYFPYATNLLISSASGPSNEITTSIGLASKIDYLKDSGTYKLSFSLNAIPTITQYYMQDLSDPTLASQVCVAEHPTIVFDSRDEQAYMIQRLPDDRCWMLDNLNLDLTKSEVVNALMPDNTNADTASLKSLKEGNRTAGAQYATAGLTLSNWGNTAYSYSQPQVNISGNCSTSGAYPCSYNGPYTNNSLAPNSADVGIGSHKIGVYYNYCAATAGSYCYGSGDSSYGNPSGNANYDICPAGWKIPTGNTSGEYQVLCKAVGSGSCNSIMIDTDPSSMQHQLSTAYSGNYGGQGISGAVTRQGVNGFYWASTGSTDASRVGGFYVTNANNSVNTIGTLARWGANSIRCILKES